MMAHKRSVSRRLDDIGGLSVSDGTCSSGMKGMFFGQRREGGRLKGARKGGAGELLILRQQVEDLRTCMQPTAS
jgi:hypothetical protein